MIDKILNNPLYLGISIAFIIVLIGIISYLIFGGKRKKRKVVLLDNSYFDKVINAISLDNIINISNNNERIIVEIKDVSLVKSNFFTEEKLGAFVSNKELKFILKDNAKEFTSYVKGKIK